MITSKDTRSELSAFGSVPRLGGWGMATSKNGTDGLADVVLTYRFHDHFSFELGVRWLDMNAKGEDIDWRLRHAWGPIFGLIANF